MITKFRPIPGHENYAINKYGIVRRLARRFRNARGRWHNLKEILISSRIDKRSGYQVIKLTSIDGQDSTHYIHRLVALAFIPNPENKKYVKLINGNKRDHYMENLKWVNGPHDKLALTVDLVQKPIINNPVQEGPQEISKEEIHSMLTYWIACLKYFKRL